MRTLKVIKLSSDANVSESPVSSESRTVTKEVLQSKGELTTWKEVEW
ncbi:hypothetical protein [Patiriisocius sp. Uisw_017]|jgi:hypothetical protein